MKHTMIARNWRAIAAFGRRLAALYRYLSCNADISAPMLGRRAKRESHVIESIGFSSDIEANRNEQIERSPAPHFGKVLCNRNRASRMGSIRKGGGYRPYRRRRRPVLYYLVGRQGSS